ncbi:MAG: hypothetical protein M0R68_00450 [Bacteroidetes bacterium]|nr:hypothetical protein [Bacteroidota bacterium]
MKYYLLFPALLFLSCSTSQVTMYIQGNETHGWKVEVEKSSNTFVLKIDGVTVIEQSYAFLAMRFETANMYKGKKIQFFGTRTRSSNANGKTITHDQIRILIDTIEVTTFDFTS